MAIVPVLAVEGGAALPEGQGRRDAVTWTIAASLLVHTLVLAVAMIWRGASIPAPEVNIPVELLSPEQYDAATRGTGTATETNAPPGSASTEPGMIRPTAMLSAAAMADAKSRQARAMMPRFDPGEQSVQLCDLEAMEQVHAWKPSFEPERIVAYAMADLAIAGDSIRADGAAFLSGGQWYTMHFDCGLSADHASVVSFAFKVGDTIPHDQWDAHNLPTAK
ncbi:MAG: DUF930 domain-containing protein [Bauldia sp.]